MQLRSILSSTLLAGTLLSSCTDKNDPAPQVPETYNFENVNYGGQIVRMQMLDSLVAKIKSANNGTKVYAADLTDIYNNTSGTLFGTDKNLSSKTYDTDRSIYYTYFSQVEELSGTADNLANGERLVTPEGVELAQLVAKGLMGAVLYYQATSHYLESGEMDVDNTQVIPGEGTAMQHHWDEAFGYFGAPADYLTNTESKRWFWAEYAEEMSVAVDVRDAIFTAFLEGRAAINRNDLTARDAAIETIRTNWDKLVAACTIHYINNSIADLNGGAPVDFYHHWSEGKGFAVSLKYNNATKISSADYSKLHELLGDNPQQTSTDNLEQALALLQQVYGFSNSEILTL